VTDGRTDEWTDRRTELRWLRRAESSLLSRVKSANLANFCKRNPEILRLERRQSRDSGSRDCSVSPVQRRRPLLCVTYTHDTGIAGIKPPIILVTSMRKYNSGPHPTTAV